MSEEIEETDEGRERSQENDPWGKNESGAAWESYIPM